ARLQEFGDRAAHRSPNIYSCIDIKTSGNHSVPRFRRQAETAVGVLREHAVVTTGRSTMVRPSKLLILALVLACARHAAGQTVAVAQLTGTVLDQSGGALPGTEVTVTQTDTGMTRFAITTESGGYVFANLPVGPYKLSAKLSGFTNFEQTGIVLEVG